MLFQPIAHLSDSEDKPQTIKEYWKVWYRLYRVLRRHMQQFEDGGKFSTAVKQVWEPTSIEGYWYRRMTTTVLGSYKCSGKLPMSIRLALFKQSSSRRSRRAGTRA